MISLLVSLALTVGPSEEPSSEPQVTAEAPSAEPTAEAPNDVTPPADPSEADEAEGEEQDATAEPEPETTDPFGDEDALEHLERAQELSARGELFSAEAEASVAIRIDPDDPAAYLERAQIRIRLADQIEDEEDAGVRRTRASLLRLAAEDVDAYLERAELQDESGAWLEARRDALLREADALDPPVAPPPVETQVEQAALETDGPVDQPRAADRRRRRIRAWSLLGTGAALGAGSAGLAAASLQIRRSCDVQGLCSATWQTRPAFLAPAAVLAALSTSAVVLGVTHAPGLDDARTRKIAGATTLSLGATGAVLSAVTGGIAAARWGSSLSPSDPQPLRSTQALANTSAASAAVALPLLAAGLTALLDGRRRARADDALARRQRAAAQ